MRHIIVLFGLLALVFSGLHAGPVAAHGAGHSHTAFAGTEDAEPGHADEGGGQSDGESSSADLNSEQGHHHSPSVTAPRLPKSDLERRFAKNLVFPSEASRLHSGSPAPLLDPPIA